MTNSDRKSDSIKCPECNVVVRPVGTSIPNCPNCGEKIPISTEESSVTANFSEELEEENEKERVCVVGLGYVGLPLAILFDQEDFHTTGFDINKSKINQIKNGVDPTGDLSNETIPNSNISVTTDPCCIANQDYVIIAVPTPVDDSNKPDLSIIEAAGETVGENITKETIVVLESTVYPGATREILIPTLEENSGLTAGVDFSAGYSPERAVPGNDSKGIRDITKIVSGQNEETLNDLCALYGSIVDAGVHPAPSLETAEAAKCLENAQRDLNIALMNEFAMGCDYLDIELDTDKVLEAAGTKWNFHNYYPGLVGGHCIPVDPYFLVHRFTKSGYSPELMQTARETNNFVANHIVTMTIQILQQRGTAITAIGDGGTTQVQGSPSNEQCLDAEVLIAGLTYKPNTNDLRSSQIEKIVSHLDKAGLHVTGFDPRVKKEVLDEQFNVPIMDSLSLQGKDALVVPTPHDEIRTLDLAEVAMEMAEDPVLVDVLGGFNKKEATNHGFDYWKL